MGKTSLTLGWLIGGRIAGQRTKAKTPIAYLYNDVQLPALPEWDKEKYPYAVIQQVGTRYYFRPFNAPSFYYNLTNEAFYIASTHLKGAGYHLDSDNSLGVVNAWVKQYDAETCGAHNGVSAPYCRNYYDIVWTNTDILNEDGSVYLAASDPIPVYE